MFVFLSLTDDKLNDQYVVQRPPARASRRKDEFIFYDKMSGELRGKSVSPTVLCGASLKFLSAAKADTNTEEASGN